ncbi:MAG: MFS transporter [Actinomycetota bacterium]
MDRRARPILLLTFVNAIGGTLLIPVLPFVVRDLGYSDFVFALLIAIYPAAQFFAAPILGSYADYRGRRPVLLVSQAGTLASWVLFGAAYYLDGGVALGVIAASRLIDGLTGGNASVAAAYLADVVEEEERTRVFSLQGAIAGVALLIGPALGSYSAATSIGFLGPALLAMGISAITLFAMFSALDESLDPDNAADDFDPNPIHQLNLIAKARGLTGRSVLGKLFSLQAGFTLTFGGYTTILVLWYVDQLGLTEADVGLMFLAVGGFLIFNEMVSLRLIERALGDVNTMLLGLALLPISLFFVRIPDSVTGFLVLSFFVNLSLALIMPTLQSVVTRAADEREEGVVQGINTSVAAAAATAAPIIAGATYDLAGGSTTILLAAVTAAGCAALGFAGAGKIRAAVGEEDMAPDWHWHRDHGPFHALAHRQGGGRRSFALHLHGRGKEHHGMR